MDADDINNAISVLSKTEFQIVFDYIIDLNLKRGRENATTNEHVVYWKDGERMVIDDDSSFESAFRSEGFSEDLLGEVAHHHKGPGSQYNWSKEKGIWEPIVTKWTLYWRHGERQILQGSGDIENAFSKAGYGFGALGALDFYIKGEDDTYKYDKEKHSWERKVPLVIG